MKNKIIYNSSQTDRINPIKIEFVYTDQKEFAAVHLFTKKGLFSYNISGLDAPTVGKGRSRIIPKYRN